MNNQLSSNRSQSIEIPTIVEDVRRALSAGAYISALALALTIPDICGKVLYPKEESGSRYRKWYCEFIGRYECPQTDVEDPNTEKCHIQVLMWYTVSVVACCMMEKYPSTTTA